jgi:transcriptional regulator with XRE-family HTH domain
MSGSDASSNLARTIGTNIRTARKVAGLKQRELSAQLDIDVMAVSNWERGVYQPSMSNLIAASQILRGGDLSWFFIERPNGDPVEAAA